MNIDELAEIFGKEVNETWNKKFKCFQVSIERVEIVDGSVLISRFGSGKTPEEARHDYARKIAGKTICVDGFQSTRTFKVPETME